MSKYTAEIKEIGHPSILTPSLCCEEKTKEELIAFWGLTDPDVEWYRLYEIADGQKVEL